MTYKATLPQYKKLADWLNLEKRIVDVMLSAKVKLETIKLSDPHSYLFCKDIVDKFLKDSYNTERRYYKKLCKALISRMITEVST